MTLYNLILYFINRRTNPEIVKRLEKRMREREEDLKTQFDLLKTLMPRVKADLEQMTIVLNFVEDKISKKVDNPTKRVKFTTL